MNDLKGLREFWNCMDEKQKQSLLSIHKVRYFFACKRRKCVAERVRCVQEHVASEASDSALCEGCQDLLQTAILALAEGKRSTALLHCSITLIRLIGIQSKRALWAALRAQ
jgi:hypothetical protein